MLIILNGIRFSLKVTDMSSSLVWTSNLRSPFRGSGWLQMLPISIRTEVDDARQYWHIASLALSLTSSHLFRKPVLNIIVKRPHFQPNATTAEASIFENGFEFGRRGRQSRAKPAVTMEEFPRVLRLRLCYR
jgi:hypothetical protein